MFCKRFKLKFWQNFCDKKSLDDKSRLFRVLLFKNYYSTVTALAKLRGLSTSRPRCNDAK